MKYFCPSNFKGMPRVPKGAPKHPTNNLNIFFLVRMVSPLRGRNTPDSLDGVCFG